MKRVLKFSLPVHNHSYEVPGRIVHAEPNGPDQVTLWAEVLIDTQRHRQYRVYGTGYLVPDGAKHVATVHPPYLVWHVYDVTGTEGES